MAYRRPGVTVTQEFVGLVPALAAFALPSVTVGPAFQLVDDDALGSYDGAEQLFPYASLLGGAIVDLGGAVDGEVLPEHPFPITLKDITAILKNTKVEVLELQETGAVAGTTFTDVTDAQFENVAAGDIVRIVEATDVEIVATRNDGTVTGIVGQKDRLYSGDGGATLFANVKAGDTVTVTTGGYFGTQAFIVRAKVSGALLLLDADISDVAADDINYVITGSRGTTNAGDYVVKSKTDANTLVLQSPVADTPEAPLSYSVLRKIGDIVLDRVSTGGNGFEASVDGVTLPFGLLYGGRPVVYGNLVASYRALRTDLAAEIHQFTNTASLNAAFGVGQTHPANLLAYGVSIMMQNTVTPVQGLGLDANGLPNEVLAYTAALDVLKLEDMYAIALLTHNPVVHTMYKNHVEQMSEPAKKLERVVIFNSRLVDLMVLQEADTTVLTANGSRQIVGMQVDGKTLTGAANILVDTTTDQFINVQKGDSVVLVSGTNVTPLTTLTVLAVTDVNSLTLSGTIVSSGSSDDINYYIYRRDGLAAGGASLYDRNAQFISNGVASGHFLSILSGAHAGRYRIATVLSEKEVTLLPVAVSAVSLATGIEYQVDRDLQKYEQADAVKGYSEAFSSRRCVHVWPDQLQVPIGQSLYFIPGFFACCAIAGLTTGLPTQQGFTNLAISGFLGFRHSTKYFSEEDLDNIADGGTMILAQAGTSQPLYIRHQLTTDRSAIKFQEFSITKNVDFIAKFLRTTFAKFIGQWNVVDTTITALKSTAGAAIKFLKDDTRVPKFGGVIRAGTLKGVTESATQIDTVDIRFGFSIPVPLNNINIVIEV